MPRQFILQTTRVKITIVHLFLFYDVNLYHGTYASSEGLAVAISGEWALASIRSSPGLDEIPQYGLVVHEEFVILYLR